MEATEGLPTWPIYRLWAAIACVGGACERRVLVRNLSHAPPIYPNLYIGLIGPPSNGKTFAIRETRYAWRASKVLKTSPDKMTQASLIDEINAAYRTTPLPNGKGYVTYRSLQMAIEEMSALVPTYDMGLMAVLNILYDNGDFEERLRNRANGQAQKLIIPNVQATFLAGGQPDYLAAAMPPHAWGQGFLSRCIFVWAPHRNEEEAEPFDDSPTRNLQKLLVEDDTKTIAHESGEMKWTPEAKSVSRAWLRAGGPPKPLHPKLEHYCGRRWIHLTKLAMISSVSRGPSHLIELRDWERALSWLLEIEKLIPIIFSQMSLGGDGALLYDAWSYLWDDWQKNQKPIRGGKLVQFVAQRCGAMNVQRVIDNMVLSGMIVQASTMDQRPGHEQYIPQAKELWSDAPQQQPPGV